MAAADVIRPIGDIGLADRPLAGGKGANLGELCRAGLPVPPGFVVTTRAFVRVMLDLDPDGALRGEIARLSPGDTAAIARVTGRIRERVSVPELPADIREAIAAGYRGLCASGDGDDEAPVAVRSSATSEDSADASFAGVADSYLWIRGERAVIDLVRRCWASLYNAEAVSYRLRQGLEERRIAMGVVVQRMVDPRAAGVMFTCSPTSGDRSVVAIEGSWGLGSVLVGGEVTPDSFVVSKVTGEIVRRTVSRKLRLHRPDPAGHGTITRAVPEPLRDRPCADDDEIRALARIGQTVEQHYGAPQDIEWALTDAPPTRGGFGGSSPEASTARIVLLQSRPETVWSGRPHAPLAVPKPRAVDHVFEQLGRVAPVAMPER
jgi:pyruvate, water dikinase